MAADANSNPGGEYRYRLVNHARFLGAARDDCRLAWGLVEDDGTLTYAGCAGHTEWLAERELSYPARLSTGVIAVAR
jgi:hypothetical protein